MEPSDTGLDGLARSVWLDLDQPQLGAALSGLHPVDGQVLGDLESLTEDISRRHRATAPRSLLPIATGHFSNLKQVMANAPVDLVPRAHAATGEAAILVGWLSWFC